jgi:hypothetical protein
MSNEPSTARNRADQLLRGVDPNVVGRDALHADVGRASDLPGAPQLDAGCVRAAYEAIADAGAQVSAQDDPVLVSLRSGARAAADAVRVADEIGVGAGGALRAAARAWAPFAVDAEADTWRAGLKAFSQTCEVSTGSDQALVVESVAAASDAIAGDDSATGRAARAFSAELQRRTLAGEKLSAAWAAAVDHAAETAPDPVFETVVSAVRGVLER